eukprot:TRINITY_DN27653_c0_g2_i1.p1 TRINITY_DN27653_c0_g2~~TRINITY_DN27653_c0_g2_i1.p1  ORF type:complete len:553 (+),score=30.30 TRINITY_DN27653_c0_g2_i1:204-1661(+)
MAGIGVVYYASNGRVGPFVSVYGALAIFIGFALTVLQAISTFKDLAIPWPAVLDDMYTAMSITIASPSSVSYVCLLGPDPTWIYAVRCAVPFVVVLMAFADFGAFKLLASALKRSDYKWNMSKLFNTIGGVLQAVFIAIVAIAALPFQCFDHPNGKSSVSAFPEVLCWGQEHVGLIVSATIVLVSFIIPFLCFTLYGSWVVTLPSEEHVRQRHIVIFRFLLYRFRPDCWWWSNTLNLRQLLLAFASSLPAGDPHVQAIYLCSLFVVYNCFLVRCWPWRSHSMNRMDSAICIGLIVFSATATAFIPAASKMEGYVLLIFLVCGVLGILLASQFVMCLYYFCRHESAPQFEPVLAPALQEATLFARWKELCSKTAATDDNIGTKCVASMNLYDRETLIRALTIWNAVQPGSGMKSRRVIFTQVVSDAQQASSLKAAAEEGCSSANGYFDEQREADRSDARDVFDWEACSEECRDRVKPGIHWSQQKS